MSENTCPNRRSNILQAGLNLTNGTRNEAYGDPHPNLTTFAHLVNVYLKGLGWTGPKLDATDGSIIMALAKISRVAVNKGHNDNYVDGAVYMAIAGECAEIDAGKDFRVTATGIPTFDDVGVKSYEEKGMVTKLKPHKHPQWCNYGKPGFLCSCGIEPHKTKLTDTEEVTVGAILKDG